MSDYTFRIWLSGLVHFVENKDPNAKCQLCIVLPRGDNNDRYRTHIGAVYEAEREIRCGAVRLKNGRKIIDLTRRRVSFEIQRFDDLPPQENLQLAGSSFGILDMSEIAGIFADQNDQIVSAYPPIDTVLAQILIGKGYYLGYDSTMSLLREWRIPETLTGYSFKILLADPIFVDIPHVRKVRMLYESIDSEGEGSVAVPKCPEPTSPVELRPGNNGMIEIFIANRCEGDDCLKAEDFEWRIEPNRLILMQLDRDFELNYQLLHPTTLDALRKILSPEGYVGLDEVRFPVPESPFFEISLAPHLCFNFPEEEKRRLGAAFELFARSRFEELDLQGILDIIKTGTGGGSGSDCLGGRGEARFNALDRYIPDPELPPNKALVQMKHQESKPKPASQLPFSGAAGKSA